MPDFKDHKMIFVVGNSRSGTTLMGSILGNGPEIFTFEELHFFDHLIASEPPLSEFSTEQATQLATQLFAIQASDWLTPASPHLFTKEAQAVVQRAQKDNEQNNATPSAVLEHFLFFKSQQQQKTIPCEQTPQNVFHIQELLTLYPNCQIVNMVRDPRAVLLSQKYKWKIRFLGTSNIPIFETFRAWANYHSAVISKLWNSSIQAAARFKDHPRVKTVRFEDLLLDPEGTTRNVCDFVGVTFKLAMLDVSQQEGGVSSLKKRPSGRGVDSGMVNRWKKGGLLAPEIHICQAITAKNMAQYDYKPATVNALGKGSSILLLVFLPFKLSLAVLLNLKRIGNLKQTIKRRILT